MRNPHKLVVLSSVLLIWGTSNLFAVDLSAEIDVKLQGMEPRARMNLGHQISAQDKVLFGGTITIRAFEKGVIIARDWKNGKTAAEVLSLYQDNLRQKPVLGIREFFLRQGGKKIYGPSVEGPHVLFGGGCRIHIFQKGVILSKLINKGEWVTEGAVFEKAFRP